MSKVVNEKLETLFAIEFGQLLENYLLSNALRESLVGIICSCLNLKSKQQLSQVFAGYDTPSTANIFELIRTINDPELTLRFLRMQTTLNVENVSLENTQNQDGLELLTSVVNDPENTEEVPYWERENSDESDRSDDDFFKELGDMSLLKNINF